MKSLFLIVTVVLVCLASVWAVSCGDDDDNDPSASSGQAPADDTDDDTSSGDNTGTDDDFDTNEIWTDTDSGLDWERAPVNSYIAWGTAYDYCDGLSLGGFDDWHLPTIDELRTLIRDCYLTQTDGSCTVTADCLHTTCQNTACSGCEMLDTGCYWPGAMHGECTIYWSSSEVSDAYYYAWRVGFYGGYVDSEYEDTESAMAVCVR